MVNPGGTALLCHGFDGYNPPDYYPVLADSNDVLAFYNPLKSGAIGGNVVSFALDSNIGTVRFTTTANISQNEYAHVFIQYVNGNSNDIYIGQVINYKFVATNILEVKYSVDWYTSFMLTKLTNNRYTFSLTCNTVLYRRLTNGEFTYLADNFTPTAVLSNKHSLSFETLDPNDQEASGNALDVNCRGYFMIYRETRTNTTHKIFMILDNGYTPSYPYYDLPENIWVSYCTSKNVIVNADIPGYEHYNQYDPDGLIFYGYTNINPELICAQNSDRHYANGYHWSLVYFTDVKVHTLGSTGFSDWTANSSRDKDYVCGDVTVYTEDEVGVSTEYSFKRILDANGEIIYDIPFTKNIEDGVLTDVMIGGPDNSPYVTFLIKSNDWKLDNSISFSFPFNQLTYYTDSFARYLAQDKQYMTDMRNLQNMNEIASGIVGGINQGAMISAFSRTQTKTKNSQSINKGIIGGGIGIAGTIAMGVYNTLYANKQESDIVDRMNRNKPDTLVMNTAYPRRLVSNAGLYSIDYDADTISAITDYQSKFGYQTNRVGTNVALNTLKGYVQAELIFSQGIRYEVAKYIKDMFSYGVTFKDFSP